jgi:hypothetical protein
VHVITLAQIYDDLDAAFPGRETIKGVNVHRVASTRFGHTDALPGRALDYLSFYWSARSCLEEIARAVDAAVVKTDPPLLSIMLAPTARRRGARSIGYRTSTPKPPPFSACR